jgi:hypothetical protein
MEFMDFEEKYERSRQGVMRLRELLDIMREQLEEGERAYERLFVSVSPEDMSSKRQKDLQGLAAIPLIDDPTPLGNAASGMRFAARNLERDFEQLFDNIMAE